ncbi:hypothetical protein DSO57_1039147 [Entomophthora muscae]|uniref:Uncharacterized protein n=1 Tax=Entomophthora muscae TaxID=34485 RepID=A0ACC2SMJ9_9FUNG|nr:hypothetical protein DSO57_1039147 [Entomophthora muscae]
MIAAICFIFYIKASLLQAYFTSKLIDPNSVGRLNLSDRFHLDSDLAWSDGRSSRYYTGLGMFNGLNEAWLDRTAKFYCPEKLSLHTINIHDAYTWVGKPVRISDLIICKEEHCEVRAQTQVTGKWAVKSKNEWQCEDWKKLLPHSIPRAAFEEKEIPKPLQKIFKDTGIWSLYFKEVSLLLDGTATKYGIKTNRSSSTNFVAAFPLSKGKELLGLVGQYNLCSSSMPVIQENNQEKFQLIKSSYCNKNDPTVLYQNY